MIRRVGAIYQEFERQLGEWRKQYAGLPPREMIRLCLPALQREELVSVAYREHLIAKRLASMPVNKQIREIVRHALVWAWKEEEMHAVYIRGLILKLGSRRLRALARCALVSRARVRGNVERAFLPATSAFLPTFLVRIVASVRVRQ
jgi:hypothetical protein